MALVLAVSQTLVQLGYGGATLRAVSAVAGTIAAALLASPLKTS
jgi:hypothetical protein